MRKTNDSPAHFRKQDLSLALLGTVLLVASALDPGGDRVSSWGHVALLLVGTSFLGWGVGAFLIGRRRLEKSADRSFLSDGFARENKWALLAVLFAVHVLATLFFFPPADVVNDRPVITLDHAFHYYQARRANEVFFETGRLHAYDPHFMAGFPSGLFDIDVKMLEIVCAPFPAAQVARVMKFFILGCYLSMVFTVYAGSRCLRLTEKEAILSVALLLVYWHWGRPLGSHFRYAGMFDFVCVSHFSILVAGLFQRFLENSRAVWWLILGPVAYFIHPTAVVILAVPYACLLLCDHREITLRKFLLFVVWCVIVIVVNSIWIVPLFEYAQVKTATKAFFQTSGVLALVRVLFKPGCLPALGLIALALPGALRLAKGGRVPTAVTVSAAFLFLLSISAYGVYIPGLRDLEPGRFLFAALIFAGPLAGVGAGLALDRWGRWSSRAPGLRPIETAAMIVLLVSPVVLSFFSARTGYKHRLTTTHAPEVRELIEEIGRRVDPSGRLMIEDGPAALYGESHVPGLLPLYTGVQQIGGPYPFTFLQHHFATFQKDLTMGKPLGEITAAEFRTYLEVYNVRWIVAASPEAKEFVASVASDTTGVPVAWSENGAAPLEAVWKSRRYTLWDVNRPPSFTTGGARRVSASFDKIQVDTGEEWDPFVLLFHWDKGLKVRPPARISPVYVLDDPVPFIRVEPNGANSVLIEY